MSKTPSVVRFRNELLARLPANDYVRLFPLLKPVPLKFKQVIYEARAEIEYAYFPNAGTLSAVVVMDDGTFIEVGTTGREGAAGLTAFLGPAISPHRLFVQVPGDALRIEVAALQQEAGRSAALHGLLTRHNVALLSQISQSVACNGLHPVLQRCCRWILMTHDRVDGDVITLTHEFLAYMLGVRRPGVTEVLQALRDQGTLTYTRGMITVLDRQRLEKSSCECYRVVKQEYERLLGPVSVPAKG